MLNTTLITPPAAEPLTLAQAKNFLRIDAPDDDSLILSLIPAVREFAEKYTRRAFFTQTWQITLDAFPFWEGRGTLPTRQRTSWPLYSAYWDSLAIRVPKPRLQNVASITYVDVNNNPQTLAPTSYYVDNSSEPGRIVPVSTLSWPTSQLYLPGTVAVTFVCGTYGDGTDVNDCPMALQIGMLMMLNYLYYNRGDQSVLADPPPAVRILLDTAKFQNFGYTNQ